MSQIDPMHTPQPISWRLILILSSPLLLGFPSGLLPSGFPTKTLYTPLLSPIRGLKGTTKPKKEFTAMRTYYTRLYLIWKRPKSSETLQLTKNVILVYNFTVHFKHYLYHHLHEIEARWRFTYTGVFYLWYVIKFTAGNHTEKTSRVFIIVHITPTQSTLPWPHQS